jgi:hypothetical protein
VTARTRGEPTETWPVQVLAIGRLEDRMRRQMDDMEETAVAMRPAGLAGEARLVRGWARRGGEVRAELFEPARLRRLGLEVRGGG